MKSLRNKKGISLVETLVASTIFIMMASGFYAALAAGDSSWQTNSVNIEVQQNLRTAMEAMIYELRQAGPASIEDPLANDTPGTQMTFQLPLGINAGSITWENDQVRFVRGGGDGNDLLRQTLSGGVVTATKTITQNISSLEFTRSSTEADSVQVDMVATGTTIKGRQIQKSLSFDLQTRN